jgi:hypothetical protein
VTHAECKEKNKNACRDLVGKHEGNRPLYRPRLWDNIKMNCKGTEWEGVVHWIYMAQHRG